MAPFSCPRWKNGVPVYDKKLTVSLVGVAGGFDPLTVHWFLTYLCCDMPALFSSCPGDPRATTDSRRWAATYSSSHNSFPVSQPPFQLPLTSPTNFCQSISLFVGAWELPGSLLVTRGPPVISHRWFCQTNMCGQQGNPLTSSAGAPPLVNQGNSTPLTCFAVFSYYFIGKADSLKSAISRLLSHDLVYDENENIQRFSFMSSCN